jgi:hypothetical protein
MQEVGASEEQVRGLPQEAMAKHKNNNKNKNINPQGEET